MNKSSLSSDIQPKNSKGYSDNSQNFSFARAESIRSIPPAPQMNEQTEKDLNEEDFEAQN